MVWPCLDPFLAAPRFSSSRRSCSVWVKKLRRASRRRRREGHDLASRQGGPAVSLVAFKKQFSGEALNSHILGRIHKGCTYTVSLRVQDHPEDVFWLQRPFSRSTNSPPRPSSAGTWTLWDMIYKIMSLIIVFLRGMDMNEHLYQHHQLYHHMASEKSFSS